MDNTASETVKLPRWIARSLAVVGAVLGCTLVYSAVTAPPHRPVIVAAMPPGTSWYVFAATLAQLLESKLPPGMDVEVFARGGGTGNPTLVERGRVAIAISQVATAVWAWEGHPIAFKGVQHRRIRALVGGLNSVWMTVAAREGYIRNSGNDTLEKILLAKPGPRIIMKPPGSTVPVALDIILAFYGTDRAGIEARGGRIIQVAVSQIPEMLSDNRADVYFETAIKGHPALTEAATLTDIRFLDFSPALLGELSRQGMKPSPLPAWFKGQTAPTASADCGTVLIARDDLPENLAYLVTKTLCENRDVMIRSHRAWTDFQPQNAWRPELTGIPLHEGSMRYYRERGWL